MNDAGTPLPPAPDGLQIDHLDPTPLPFGQDPDRDIAETVLPAFADWLFGDAARSASESGVPDDGPCHTYAIIDAGRVQGCVEMLEASDLEYACLYSGEKAEEMPDLAPWLVALDADNLLLRKLMLASTETPPPGWALWHAAPALFIRSRLGLPHLRRHLRRFGQIDVEGGNPVFLRYWDPLIFQDIVTAYGTAGLTSLFENIHSLVVYHSRAAMRLTMRVPVKPARVCITDRHSAHYKALRQARLADAVTDHFMTLPDFADQDASDMHPRVVSYLKQARRIGLREAADMHQLALGLALSRTEDSFRSELRAAFDREDISATTRRDNIMALVAGRIDVAQAASQKGAAE